MNTEPRESEELIGLLLRFTAGERLESEQIDRLNEMLVDPELAADAVAILDLQAGLRDAHQGEWSLIEQALRSTQATPKPQLPMGLGNGGTIGTSSFGRIALIAASVLILTNLLVGTVVWFSKSQPAVNVVQQPDRPASPLARAPTLVSMTACVWSPTVATEPAIGYSIPKGKTLHLLEGIAELDLGLGESNRARVTMEGPGSIFTTSDGLLRLNFGALTADVSWYEGAFSIDTPNGRVTVNGNASLGIVANNPQSEVHVFKGDVTIESISPNEPNSVVHLGAGEAASLAATTGRDTNVTLFEASSVSFASARSMAFDRLKIDQSYRDMIKKADPAIYWKFEDSVDNTVINQGSLDGFNAYIDGAVSWRQFGENRAAEFGLTGTVGSFLSRNTWPDKPLESYTIEMWVKPSHFHNGALICLVEPKPMPGGRYPHGMFLEIGGEFDPKSKNPALTSVRFVHRSVPSVDRLQGTSVSAKDSYRVRIWQHIVARKDGEKMELIIDGNVVAQDTDASMLPAKMQIVIGQLFPKLTIRPFVGQIDEVAFYERALTDEEIKEHFEAAKPPAEFSDDPIDDEAM